MTALAKAKLRQLYYQHGIFTFLLFFAPLLPGVIESHTKAYLKLVNSLSGNATSTEDAVKVVFGRRGLKEYQKFISDNPQLVRPSQIFRSLYQDKDSNKTLNLINTMFFREKQRHYPHADVFRTTVIREIPRMFQAFSHKQHQSFRSEIVQMLATLSIIDQALEPKIAMIDVATQLLEETHAIEKLRRQHRINVQFQLLEAKIKAELAGKATASDPEFLKLHDGGPQKKHLLTQADIYALKKIVNNLTHEASPDIVEAAKEKLLKINDLSLALA